MPSVFEIAPIRRLYSKVRIQVSDIF